MCPTSCTQGFTLYRAAQRQIISGHSRVKGKHSEDEVFQFMMTI